MDNASLRDMSRCGVACAGARGVRGQRMRPGPHVRRARVHRHRLDDGGAPAPDTPIEAGWRASGRFRRSAKP
jgi:hypothetical protein